MIYVEGVSNKGTPYFYAKKQERKELHEKCNTKGTDGWNDAASDSEEKGQHRTPFRGERRPVPVRYEPVP